MENKKRQKFAAGLSSLVVPQQNVKGNAAPAVEDKAEVKPFCYTLPVELADKMRYIAFYERKRINEVIAEAFRAYVDNWNSQPHPAEHAKKI